MDPYPVKRAHDIKCGVCLDVYKDPQLLSCLHTFCKSCLKVSAETNKITCPVCRKEDDASDLLPNSMLADKIKASGAGSTSSVCGQCMSWPVVIFCRECDDYLCQQCKVAHEKMAILESHKPHLFSVGEAKRLPKLRREYKCPKHKEMTLNVYCVKCQVAICKDCALYKHQGHTFKPAEEAAPEVKRKLTSSITTSKKQQEEFQRHSQTIAQAEKHVTTYPDELKFFITREFDKLIQELEARKQHLLKTVDAKYDSFSKTLWAEKNTIDITLSRIEAGIKIAQEICESQKDLELAVLGAQACKSLEKVNVVDWNPAVVKSLGPLVYLRKDDNTSDQPATTQTESQFINNIGGLVDLKSHDELKVTLKLHKYEDNESNSIGKKHSVEVIPSYQTSRFGSSSQDIKSFVGQVQPYSYSQNARSLTPIASYPRYSTPNDENHKTFVKGRTVVVKVTSINLKQVGDILFPYKLNSKVIRVGRSSTRREILHTFNGQDITFTTTNPGEYTITVSKETTDISAVISSLILHFNEY
jgi:hypothetical protein